MKNIVFYRLFLGMRKIIVYLLITVIAIGLALYFIVNSAFVVREVAQLYAPDYNISYSRIHGNVLTGVKIEDLAYNDDPLAKHVTLKWNPSGLLKKTIMVNTLRVEQANVDTIKRLIASFSSVESNESNESTAAEPLGIGVSVDHASLSLEPFEEQGITISNVILKVNDVQYTDESLDIRALELKVDSNVTDIFLDASLKKGDVHIRELNITNVDVLALQALFVPDANESNVSNENDTIVSTEDNAPYEKSQDPLMPKRVHLDTLQISILPLVYNVIDMRQLTLTGKDALFDIEKRMLQKAKLDLYSSTNLSDIHYKTKVKNNKLIGKVDFKPKKALFELYELPVRREAVGDIAVDLNVSETMVSTDLKITMEQLLKAGQNDFNLDINHLHVHATYDIDKSSVEAKSDLLLTTPYAKDVAVTNLFTMDKHISYSGEIHADQFIGVDEKFVKPLNNLQVKYQGDIQSIQADIDSKNLQGIFSSPDFKKAELHLENKQPLELNAFMTLPAELNQTKANVRIDAPISFEENGTTSLNAKIDSDVVNIDANATYKELLQLNTIAYIPKDSPLHTYNEALKWDSLNPLKSEVTLQGNTISALLTAGTIRVNTQYDLNTTQINGRVVLGGLNADVSGIVDKKMTVDTRINSMNALIDSVKSIYTLGDVPIVKGSADISMELTEMKAVDVTLKSPKIIYQADSKTEQHVNDIDLALHMEDQTVVLQRYALEFAGQKLFSTKPSTVSFDEENVSIAPLWINDQLKVEGEYNLQTRKGTIDTKAEKLHIAHEIVDLDSDINIRTLLDGNKTSVNGEITLLGGHIHYDLEQKTYASDSDIIIVQDMKKEEPSPFMDGLSTSVQIKTKQPLIYKKGAVDMKADVDINVYKAEGSDLLVLGSVELLKGGSYTFEGKKFILGKSHVYFTGDPNKPLLDVSVDYKSLHHLITIMVTGSADTPNITFSSKPTLTKEQILSVILFGSESGAGTSSGEDMMKMMGGAMAKSALSNLGVQLDYLAFGAGNSLEVGKKLTDDITIIYVNDEISSVKLKYDHGAHTQSVIGVSEESQSYDILYKKDF